MYEYPGYKLFAKRWNHFNFLKNVAEVCGLPQTSATHQRALVLILIAIFLDRDFVKPFTYIQGTRLSYSTEKILPAVNIFLTILKCCKILPGVTNFGH